MPQLSTIYIFLIYLWLWLMLYLTTQKIKTTSINKITTNTLHIKPKKLTLDLPWM